MKNLVMLHNKSLIPFLKMIKKIMMKRLLITKNSQTTKPNSYKISIDNVKKHSKLIARY